MSTSRRKPRQFAFTLNAEDFRILAILAGVAGLSKAETLRELIRRTYQEHVRG